MKRIFIAVKVEAGPEMVRLTANLKALLGGESIKWVDQGNIHLTLAFLGDTEEKLIRTLSLMLKDRVSGFGEFDFLLKGTGIFKNFNDPRVIWIGISSSERLIMLNIIIESGLKDMGFRTEDRVFRPHLTVGRIRSVKDINNLKSVLGKYQDSAIQAVHVSEVFLYESILMQTGPLYKPLAKLRL
jgi:2'-5' RNA ligase